MHHAVVATCFVSQFCSEYEDYLVRFRGLSVSTRKLHGYVVRKFLNFRFPDGNVKWSQLRFNDVVDFLGTEFAHHSSRDTQRAWLMILRSVLRYLADSGRIPQGWDGALPKITSYSQARLPKNLSKDQVRALFSASRGRKRRHARYRVLLLLCLRLGLRVQEVANLVPGDIDWKNGCLRVRCTKTYNDRVLPFPQDVGDALDAHLRNCQEHPSRVFEPLRPPCTAQRCYIHVLNSIRYLFALAGITDRGTHSLRHTAATETSRNLRLTAIHSFFRLVALRDPASVGIATRVLAIPLKRTDTRVRPYVAREEMDAILAVLDRTTWCGRRDHTLLLTMYNTGARVSEMSSLKQDQISFGAKSYVHLHGKGRKERTVPLWSRTARTIKEWLREIGRSDNALVFPNVRGEPLSRFAIHLLLRKAVQRAVCRCPSLKRKRVSPHVIRHGTAMALLQSGVDIAVIALWLGHESIETTNIYVHANLAMKEKALEKVMPMDTPFRRFRADDSLLAFLESL